jgi:alpha-galactosidase
MLLHLYYGAKIQGDADDMLMYKDRGFSGNPYDAGMDRTYSIDTLPREYPGIGTGDFRSSAIVVRNADATECCDLRYVDYQITKGKYRLEGLPAVYASDEEAETLTIIMEDPITKLQVKLLYGVLEKEDIITRSAIILNKGEGQVVVEKAASACLDFLYGNYDLISFHGRHMMERNFQRTEIVHANQVIGSRRGVSSHQYNPAVIIADQDATEDAGSCYGMMFVYSGNFVCEAEKDQFGNTRALMGLQSDLFHYPLEKGETLIVPENARLRNDIREWTGSKGHIGAAYTLLRNVMILTVISDWVTICLETEKYVTDRLVFIPFSPKRTSSASLIWRQAAVYRPVMREFLSFLEIQNMNSK